MQMNESRLFDYKNFSDWGDSFLSNSQDILTTQIVELMRAAGDGLGGGEEIIEWFDRAVFEKLGIENAANILTDRLRRKFSLIRLYHGTRIESLAPILHNGLIPGRSNRVEARAREIFGNGQFAGVTDVHLNKIFEEFRPRVDHQADRVFFCLDDRNFEKCGHYLIYGSEYLLWVAAQLQSNDGYGNPAYHERLRAEGIPAVVVVNFPIQNLPEKYSELWQRMIVGILWKLAEDGSSWRVLDYTITLNGVEPKHIVTHYHPAEISDPLYGFVVRTTRVTKCESCNGS